MIIKFLQIINNENQIEIETLTLLAYNLNTHDHKVKGCKACSPLCFHTANAVCHISVPMPHLFFRAIPCIHMHHTRTLYTPTYIPDRTSSCNSDAQTYHAHAA